MGASASAKRRKTKSKETSPSLVVSEPQAPSPCVITDLEPRKPEILRIIHVNDVYSLDRFPHLQTLCDKYRNKNTVLTHGGDFLSPYLLSSLDCGKSMVRCMNAVRFDIVCFGNHEADFKNSQLFKRIQESDFAWVNTNIPDLTLPDGGKLPLYCIKEIGGKKIAFLGVVTNEEDLYISSRFGGCKMEDPNETCRKFTERLKEKLKCDLVICLTHQDMADDRLLARMGVTNLILGGHEHEIFLEVHEGCHIVKTGESLEYAAVIDMELSNPPRITTQLLRLDQFQPAPEIQKLVQSCTKMLDSLTDVKLMDIGDTILTPKGARKGPNKLGSLIATSWKEVLGADIAFINGGGVRGKSHEMRGIITLNDINITIPFKDSIEKVSIPGRILNEAIKYSRDLGDSGENGGFLHCDKFVCFTRAGDIESISLQPFDPERNYMVATRKYILDGGNDILPLKQWMEQAKPKRFECGVDIAITVNYFCDLFWLNLVETHANQYSNDKVMMNREDVEKALMEKFDSDVATPMVDVFFTAAGLEEDEFNINDVKDLVDFHSANFSDILAHDDPINDQYNVLSSLTRESTSYNVMKPDVKRFQMSGHYNYAILPKLTRAGTVIDLNTPSEFGFTPRSSQSFTFDLPLPYNTSSDGSRTSPGFTKENEFYGRVTAECLM